MPKKPNLFTPGAATEEAAADVVVETIKAEDINLAEPTPVAELRPVAALPARGELGIRKSAEEWRTQLIPSLEQKLANVKAQLEQLGEQADAIALCVELELDGAEAQAAEHEERCLQLENERKKVERALRRARGELTRAEKQEAEAERQRRVERARKLVRERVSVCARFDAVLAQLATVAAELSVSTRRLSGFANDTGVAPSRLLLSGAYIGAAWHAGEELGKMLDLARDKPLPAMRSLAETEVRFWRRFVGDIEIPAVAPDAVEAEAPELDDPLIGQHGGVVLGEPLSTGGKVYEPDAVLPPELCVKWPLPNRRALAKQQRVRFFTEPQPAAAGETELMS